MSDCKQKRHGILTGKGPQELPPNMQEKYPDGVELGNCKNCDSTIVFRVFNEKRELPQFKQDPES